MNVEDVDELLDFWCLFFYRKWAMINSYSIGFDTKWWPQAPVTISTSDNQKEDFDELNHIPCKYAGHGSKQTPHDNVGVWNKIPA